MPIGRNKFYTVLDFQSHNYSHFQGVSATYDEIYRELPTSVCLKARSVDTLIIIQTLDDRGLAAFL